MHRALLVDDIVHAVLQNVTSSATDMVNFASTCSAVSFPTLNILWRMQSSLGPLIMCLPQDTWEIRGDNVVYLTREPFPTEWERVRLHASRIRKLVAKPRDTRPNRPPKVHSGVLQPLFVLFPPSSLFPNLSNLDFSAVSDLRELTPKLQFSILRQFLSPMLGFLAFIVPSTVSTHELEGFVNILPEASDLRQLVISAENDGEPRRQIHLPLSKMQKLNALGVIHNVCLANRCMADIEQLRFLHVLALDLEGGHNDGEDSRLGDVPLELSLLGFLTLDADRMQHCTSFLHRISTPQLSNISIKYSEHALSAEVNDFLLSLRASCPVSASLETLSVHCYGDISYRDLDLHNSLTSDVFRPLLTFGRLTVVKFLATGKFHLDDGFMEAAAVAWPDVQELSFASKHSDTSSVTFDAVLSFASRCSSLRSLHLTFDATQMPKLPRRKGCEDASDGNWELWPKQTALQMLHVGNSKVRMAVLVPFVLAAVFPNLLDISSYQLVGISDGIRWERVARAFRKLVGLRKKDPVIADSLPMFVQAMLADDLQPESS
ncbi:hypothetical protein M405DRAFT_847805 [Rhizopogon salebrosus TDB-379]|nr:hypothetical protein M405DRAFT_847805 [Rhizopogon salebrosus TDB-379]